MKDSSVHFEIKLPCFEGPFDLLLFFIMREDIDIHDIPITPITHKYLAYIKQMQALNVTLAAEFMWVAATLIRLKARALLPLSSPSPDEDQDSSQSALVEHLLVYKKYKMLAQSLQTLATQRETQSARGNLAQEILQLHKTYALDIRFHALAPPDLYNAYQRLTMRNQLRTQYTPPPVLRSFSYTLVQQKQYLLKQVALRKRLSFLDMASEQPEKILLIFNILAILDLWHAGKLQVHVGPGYNHFWIEAAHNKPSS